MKPTDFLTELSTEKLAQYKTAAAADASKADKESDFKRGDKRFSGIVKATKKQFANDAKQGVAEEWSQKYKSSINCSHPKGFSQKAHCAGKKKHNESIEMEMTCPDCGMCQTHGDHSKDKLDELSCWSGYHRVAGTKAGFPGSCAKNKTNEEQLNELDMFAPRTVYFKMADGNYIKADYRGSEGLSGHKGNDNVTFTAMSWVPPNTARTLGLDKFLAKGSDPDLGTTRQNAQSIVGTSSPGEGPLGNRTIDVVDFVNGKEDTVPSQLKTQVMQWVQKNQSKPQAPAQGMAEGLDGQVVFSGTGANGVKYEIIQSGDDFMIHANGRHIDSYGSLQRAMSVLKNEVPGLTKGVAGGIMNTIANKVMGAAPEQPKYKVGQRVKYETSPHQPDWEDGGSGVGVITDYKNGHYMINGNPVNHFEIKGVVGQGVAEGSLEEDRGMKQYWAFKREWRAKHGANAKVPAYDSKEYNAYCWRQGDKQQGVAEGEVQSDDLYNVVIEYFNGGKGYKNAMILRSKAENGTPVEDLAKLLNNFLMKKWGSKLNNSNAIDAVKNIVYPHVLEQGVVEGLPGSLSQSDYMPGPRGINLPSAPTKKFFTDKQKWMQAVDDINHSKYDDNSDYTGVTGRSTVSIDGREWARWSDAQQKGYIELSSMSEQGMAEGSTETPQQQQVRAAISKGMAKWDQNDLATYQSQPAIRNYFAASDWASGQLEGINSIDPDGTVVIELDDTTTAGLVKKLASLGGMPGVKTRQLKMTFDPSKANAAGVTQGIVAEEKCPHCGGVMVSEELMNEKKDACYYKVKSRYKVWPSAYASGALVKCRKSHGNWGKGSKNESSILEGIERADENLHKWFKEKWVRFGPDGKIRGACARGDDSEGKPKCLPQSKAQNLGKKGRASAAARKRREDPNPERSGKAINVATKKK